MPVGVAFQLRDDLLGAFGDPEATGKPLGSDLRSGKRTVLLTTALRRARGRDHRLLKSVVGTPRASDAKVRAAIGVLERSGAKAAVEARIADLVTSAEVALRAGRIPADASALLRGAAHALTERGT
jgi:geranylgeranyl diphosphate synthase type I